MVEDKRRLSVVLFGNDDILSRAASVVASPDRCIPILNRNDWLEKPTSLGGADKLIAW